MGEWVDVTLNVEAKNLDRVLSVFKDNSIEVVGFEKPDKLYNDGSDTVTIEMGTRNYGEFDEEADLLLKNNIQYTYWNSGISGVVTAETNHMRILNGEPVHINYSTEFEGLLFTEIQHLMMNANNLEELIDLVQIEEKKRQYPDW